MPLDKAIEKALTSKGWEVKPCQPFRKLKGSDNRYFSIDLSSEKHKLLIEREKGKLPRLESDIIKIMSAAPLDDFTKWQYGVLIVPSSYIKMTLAPNTTPFGYLERLKPLAKSLYCSSKELKGLVVIGYEDPRSLISERKQK